MDKSDDERTRALAEEAIELAGEVEASGDMTDLEYSKAQMHRWIDEAKAVVAIPGLGRVTIIHENGRKSSIASPDLPLRLSRPVKHSS